MKINRRSALLSLAIFCSSLSLAQMAGAEAGNDYLVPLSANTITPKIVQTEGSGTVELHYDKEKGEMTYELRVDNLEDVRMAHLHLGDGSRKGFRVAWLFPANATHPALAPGRNDGVLARGTLLDKDLVGPLKGKSLQDLALMIQNGQFYVDVHTAGFPTGELSGRASQIRLGTR